MEANSKPDRERFWRRHITRCRALNSKVAPYCRAEGLSQFQFRYWSKRLDAEPIRAPAFVPVEVMPELASRRSPLPDQKWLAELIFHLTSEGAPR